MRVNDKGLGGGLACMQDSLSAPRCADKAIFSLAGGAERHIEPSQHPVGHNPGACERGHRWVRVRGASVGAQSTEQRKKCVLESWRGGQRKGRAMKQGEGAG
jgi:hypothetical protein